MLLVKEKSQDEELPSTNQDKKCSKVGNVLQAQRRGFQMFMYVHRQCVSGAGLLKRDLEAKHENLAT